MPEVIETFITQAERLRDIADRLEEACGQSNANTAVLWQFASQMDKMADKPDKIASNYSSFKDNIGALGDAILNMRSQPLALDYLLVTEESAELPEAEPGFFARLAYQVQLFMQSFTRDYTLVNTAAVDSDREPVVVWIGSGITGGRDQAQLLNRMIEQDFLKRHDVPVQLQLTSSGTILVATLAGMGPDVALQIGGSSPVDFAMRNTVYDLTQFDDYEEVAQRFFPSAITPFTFEGGVYALPETQSFYVMFYRSDILSRLNIDVNNLKTWQNVIQVLGTLQESNMSIALPANMTTYAMFLYQMGGEFYKDNNRKTALDEEVSIQAFKLWTNFYVNYQVPIEYSFENRFRLGEMPLGIADYTTYNLLSVSAPEIAGLWGIAPLPGIQQEDGTINNTSPGAGAGAVIMSACEDKEGAWEFLKWWTSASVQQEFGNELESIMGAAARYNTANVEAAATLPWSVQNRTILMSQWESARGIPEVAGGYYTSRYVDFAMREVVNNNASQRDTLLSYVDTINEEIALKRNEFDLD
ncbi:MAG: extracellular solute-binding protein, partial [Clostridia bacterium]|nr:extracellular solute-binding protein [Clostridia bacterium]